MGKVGLAVCSLNQWALSFRSNTKNIESAISIAAEQGADLLVCPELAITGYGCEDHFLEHDVLEHSWECLARILESGTKGIVCDIGMPVLYNGVRYNCRVLCLDHRILLIRPKKYMANDHNYRELRWFSSWKQEGQLTVLRLPEELVSVCHQTEVPFGDGYLDFSDTSVGCECCEELFTAVQASSSLALSGVQIFSNGSASHHERGKLKKRLELMTDVTGRCGGVYLYSNQQGCDGGRLYYDGCASIVMNGQVLVQGDQFTLREVNVWTAHIDLDEVVSFRASKSSFMEQASSQHGRAPAVKLSYSLSQQQHQFAPSCCPQVKHYTPEEEIALGPACWLWDYLRRSGAAGFLLPLSGGADSSAVAAIVGSMCQLVLKEIEQGDKQVLEDAIRIGNYKNGEQPRSHQEFAGRIFETVYMGSENSSVATRTRAAKLADEVGSRHWDLSIDKIVKTLVMVFATMTGRSLRYKVDGGTVAENLALQNVQARVRMVMAYMLASLLPWVGGKTGFYLVLGCANADESLRGYFTKYDCSSADINPIGAVSKNDLRSFLRWAADPLGYPVLAEVEVAPPTAELEPIREDYKQIDEVDMGMTYDELQKFGTLRKVYNLGPVSMFKRLLDREWRTLGAKEVATKVKMFFKCYAVNRHKMTTLTPSYHAESYSPDDNRFDLRPFLYNAAWPWQFEKIDKLVRRATPKLLCPPSCGLLDLVKPELAEVELV